MYACRVAPLPTGVQLRPGVQGLARRRVERADEGHGGVRAKEVPQAGSGGEVRGGGPGGPLSARTKQSSKAFLQSTPLF